MQRLPGEFLRGAGKLARVAYWMVDLDAATVEAYAVEVRKSRISAAGRTEPDLSPAGLMASSSKSPPYTSGASGIFGFIDGFQLPGGGLDLTPAAAGGLPGDVFLCIRVPANNNWPLDGFEVIVSSGNNGEKPRAGALGFTGVPGEVGLAWSYTPSTGSLVVEDSTTAWNICAFFTGDTVQPGATTPTTTWNFGYAGLFPDWSRGDVPIVLSCSSAPGGELAVLLYSTQLLPSPIPVPFPATGTSAGLHLSNPLIGRVTTTVWAAGSPSPRAGNVVYGSGGNSGRPAWLSEAIYSLGNTSLSIVGLDIYAQSAVFVTGSGLQLSSVGRVRL